MIKSLLHNTHVDVKVFKIHHISVQLSSSNQVTQLQHRFVTLLNKHAAARPKLVSETYSCIAVIFLPHFICVTIGTAHCSLSWWYQHYWSSGEEAINEIFTEAWKPSFYSWQNGEVKFMSHTIALPLAGPKQKQRLIFGYLGKISIDLERSEWLA